MTKSLFGRRVGRALTVGSLVGIAVVASHAALAQDTLEAPAKDSAIYIDSLAALTKLFVLAVLIESALTVIFNWRLFKEFFAGRGVRTLVMIAVSALVVWTFKVDTVRDLMVAYGFDEAPASNLSLWLTALILAGGSAGVYNILVALGYRDRKDTAPAAARPPANKAWVSIRVVRNEADGPVLVKLDKFTTAPPVKPFATVAVIGRRSFFRRLISIFLLDPSRFPPTAGYEVEPGQNYRLQVEGHRKDGTSIKSSIDGDYVFADRAVVDLEVAI